MELHKTVQLQIAEEFSYCKCSIIGCILIFNNSLFEQICDAQINLTALTLRPDAIERRRSNERPEYMGVWLDLPRW